MAFNGITIHALTDELRKELLGTHISKISQPEPQELLLTIKLKRGTKRLLISANASLPLIYLTDNNKVSPLNAPNFCMLLRKHIANGLIKDIEQVGLERVIKFTIEHRDEMGDLTKKYLYVEIMSKHSNIIFTNSENMILDSIKHISAAVSSVREVLPGKEYFIPTQEDKVNPFMITKDEFIELISKKAMGLSKAIYTSFTGFSPVTGLELSVRASLDADQSTTPPEGKASQICQALGQLDTLERHAVNKGTVINHGHRGRYVDALQMSTTIETAVRDSRQCFG
jgi:predicted ribosome quality control (RQC) complex YloA/Tae2 family protein